MTVKKRLLERSFWFGANLVKFVSVAVLPILPRHTTLTAGFAKTLWHIGGAHSSPMLPDTIFTQIQLGMSEPGFKPTTLWLDILSSFELLF